jgi:NAD(P)-dependent dehydrogenase (short-subunit alcohol dehydrogenase family)
VSEDQNGRVAIVTGAGFGIGRAEALRLAADGAAVVVNDFDPARGEETVTMITAAGGRAVVSAGDVSDVAVADASVRRALGEFGRLDVLVNNAGNSRPRFITNMSDEDWDLVIGVHLRGTFAFTRAAAIHWKEEAARTGPTGATVVNTTSVNGLHGIPGYANYVTAKGGIASLTGMLSRELAAFGVRVNAIAPLAFSAMTEPMWGGEVFSDERRDELSPDNVATVVGWLASPRSAPLTGEIVNFSGARLSTVAEWPEKGNATASGAVWDYAQLDASREELFGG